MRLFIRIPQNGAFTEGSEALSIGERFPPTADKIFGDNFRCAITEVLGVLFVKLQLYQIKSNNVVLWTCFVWTHFNFNLIAPHTP